MKRDPVSATLLAAVFAASAVSASVLGFATAFELPTTAAFLVVVMIAAAAVGGAFVARARKGPLWLLIGSIAFGVVVALLGGVDAGAVLIDQVTMIYQQSYDWPATAFAADQAVRSSTDMALVLVGGILAAWVAFMMARRVPPVAPIVLSVVPLAPCFLVLHTVPHVLCVFLLVLTLLTYLLSASGNGKKPLSVTRTAITAVCVLAVTAVLFVLIQPDGEYNKVGDRRDQLLSFLGIGSGGGGGATDHTSYEDTMMMRFNEAGASSKHGDDLVATLYSEKEDILYLREQDYAVYQYGSWMSQKGYEERMNAPTAYSDSYFVIIETPEVYSRKFVPYYAKGYVQLENGNLQNVERTASYEWSVVDSGETWRQIVYERREHYENIYYSVYANEGLETFLSIPMTTKLWAQDTLDTIFSGMEVTNTDKADAVAAFVRNSAAYVRDIEDWQWEGDDFAQWFIETQDEGNCIHFATAAAVLLRAANVPTRFVTGYLTEAKTKQWVAVTEKQAHAWVEYYEPTVGRWLVLEATPLAIFSSVADATSTRPTMETTASTQATTTSPITTSPTQLPPIVYEEERPLTVWLSVLGGVVVLGMVLYLQRTVRLALGKRRQMHGTPNERAHHYWRVIVRLAKALGESPPTEAKVLAEKAKFSQHILTTAELDTLAACMEALRARVKARPWYQKPWHCLILALY